MSHWVSLEFWHLIKYWFQRQFERENGKSCSRHEKAPGKNVKMKKNCSWPHLVRFSFLKRNLICLERDIHEQVSTFFCACHSSHSKWCRYHPSHVDDDLLSHCHLSHASDGAVDTWAFSSDFSLYCSHFAPRRVDRAVVESPEYFYLSFEKLNLRQRSDRILCSFQINLLYACGKNVNLHVKKTFM